MRRLITLLALLLVVSACGDDDAAPGTTSGSVDAPSELVASLRTQIESSPANTGGFEVDNEQAGCFAVGLVDAFGSTRMAEAVDLQFPDFMASISTAERRQVVDIMFDCVDVTAAMSAEMSANGDVSTESARCVAEAMIGSDEFRDALAASFGSTADPFEDPDLVAALLPSMLSCLSADELSGIIGSGG